ncbi:hypothetical protein UlMin_028221 [Ulmus minor]
MKMKMERRRSIVSTCQLNKYKNDVDDVNKRTGGTDGAKFDGADLIGSTRHLMNVVNSLHELTEWKKEIDKHTNIVTVLLGEIKERGIDRSELLGVLKGKGSKINKLRFAIIYLAVEVALRESKVDTCAFQYMKKIKSLNVLLASANSKLYGQSIGAMTIGVKNLLSNDQQLALTRTMEPLMEGKPNPEIDFYLVFDPHVPKSSSGTISSHLKGPFKEAIVFMIGGGNYHQQPVKHVIYGTIEILTGEEFVDQLSLLGQKMGLGGAPVVAASSSTH